MYNITSPKRSLAMSAISHSEYIIRDETSYLKRVRSLLTLSHAGMFHTCLNKHMVLIPKRGCEKHSIRIYTCKEILKTQVCVVAYRHYLNQTNSLQEIRLVFTYTGTACAQIIKSQTRYNMRFQKTGTA